MCSNNIDIGELPFSFHEEKSFNCIIENSHTVIHAHGGRAYSLGHTPFENGKLNIDNSDVIIYCITLYQWRI